MGKEVAEEMRKFIAISTYWSCWLLVSMAYAQLLIFILPKANVVFYGFFIGVAASYLSFRTIPPQEKFVQRLHNLKEQPQLSA